MSHGSAAIDCKLNFRAYSTRIPEGVNCHVCRLATWRPHGSTNLAQPARGAHNHRHPASPWTPGDHCLPATWEHERGSSACSQASGEQPGQNNTLLADVDDWTPVRVAFRLAEDLPGGRCDISLAKKDESSQILQGIPFRPAEVGMRRLARAVADGEQYGGNRVWNRRSL